MPAAFVDVIRKLAVTQRYRPCGSSIAYRSCNIAMPSQRGYGRSIRITIISSGRMAAPEQSDTARDADMLPQMHLIAVVVGVVAMQFAAAF